MIFITDKEHKNPLFRGYVNKVLEKTMPNGGTIKTYIVGTTEKDREGNKVYSKWFCNLIGEARKNEELLQENTPIDVYGFKQTNISKKNEDGSWGRAFFNMSISDFEVHQFEPRQTEPEDTENTPF